MKNKKAQEQEYEEIAQLVTTETVTGGAKVTAEQIKAIANAKDKCYSHPVHQAVLIELRKRGLI